jgi:hypothetical protein
MQYFFRFIFYFLSLFVCVQISAQTTSNGYTSSQLWSSVSFLQGFKKKFVSQLDLQYFSCNSSANKYAILNTPTSFTARAWCHYFLKPSIRISGSVDFWDYAEVPEIHQKKGFEIRPAIQFQETWVYSRFTFIAKAREEFRFIKTQSADEFKYSSRLRVMPKVFVALNSKSIRAETLYLICYNEIFLDRNTPSFIEQNRLSLGLGYCLNKNTTLESSYLHRSINPSSDLPQITNALVLNLRFNNFLQMLK